MIYTVQPMLYFFIFFASKSLLQRVYANNVVPEAVSLYSKNTEN